MQNSADTVETILENYCRDFDAQIAFLIDHAENLAESDENLTLFTRSVYSEVHRMGGAAHCLGFKRVGSEFRAVEAELEELQDQPAKIVKSRIPAFITKLQSLRKYTGEVKPYNSKLRRTGTSLSDFAYAEAPDPLAKARQDTQKRIMSRESILFADDDPYIRELMHHTLSGMGVKTVMLAASGSDVLSIVKTKQPSFVITDWQMEPISGLDLVRMIRRNETPLDTDTPVIFLTSRKDRKSAQTAISHGANKVLGKPIHPTRLAQTVLRIMEKRFRVAESRAQATLN